LLPIAFSQTPSFFLQVGEGANTVRWNSAAANAITGAPQADKLAARPPTVRLMVHCGVGNPDPDEGSA